MDHDVTVILNNDQVAGKSGAEIRKLVKYSRTSEVGTIATSEPPSEIEVECQNTEDFNEIGSFHRFEFLPSTKSKELFL